MSELQQYAHSAGLGDIEISLRLDGPMPGGEAPAQLVLTERGCWLIAATSAEQGQHVDIARNPSLRYTSRVLGDRVKVDGHTYGVPLGRATEARQMLAIGRLRARSAKQDVPTPTGRYIDPATHVQLAWLKATLNPGELPLAWLDSGTDVVVQSSVQGDDKAAWRLLVTSERSLLAAVGELGDAECRPLPAETLIVRKQLGRAQVSAGELSWLATLSNGTHYAEVARLPALGRVERIREVARRNYAEHPEVAEALLRTLEAEGAPLDRLLGALARGEAVDALLSALRASEDSGPHLARVLESWGFEGERLMRLVVGGVDQDPERAAWLLPVHRLAHRVRLRTLEDPARRVQADIALSEHLILAGEPGEAVERLEAALRALPDEQLSDLLPPDDADLTAGEAGQVQRIRILELLVCARGETDTPDVSTLAELARLQPLVPARLGELLEAADGPLAQRAARALAALEGIAFQDDAAATPPLPAPRCLPEALVRARLQHPAAREEGVMGWMQGWLAKQAVPEQSTLKRYCEALSARRQPAASAALTDATMAFGMPGLEAYVSHGTLGTGLRAYEGDPSFVLIGGQHLYDDTELYLRAGELRFALGAELAHLLFKHTRVTGEEVWDGVADKLRRLLDVTATALSFGSYAPVGKVLGEQRTYRLVSSVFSEATLKRIYQVEDGAKLVTHVGADAGRILAAGASGVDTAKGVTESAGGALARLRGATEDRSGSVGVRQAELIAAHRVMQLTADRAGLLLCDDLVSALRALFLVDPQARTELPIAERHGLVAALSRRGPDGSMLHQELAVRVAALISFYLSEDYSALREALGYPAPAEEGAGEE
ncbi:MAG: hypothetical protein H6740_08795 [Alphaproteobacteria bacterium]|nr:hypothetical protein [Alphaproteobacteria bacterium]